MCLFSVLWMIYGSINMVIVFSTLPSMDCSFPYYVYVTPDFYKAALLPRS